MVADQGGGWLMPPMIAKILADAQKSAAGFSRSVHFLPFLAAIQISPVDYRLAGAPTICAGFQMGSVGRLQMRRMLQSPRRTSHGNTLDEKRPGHQATDRV
jgi:hypothetical protein